MALKFTGGKAVDNGANARAVNTLREAGKGVMQADLEMGSAVGHLRTAGFDAEAIQAKRLQDKANALFTEFKNLYNDIQRKTGL